MLTAALATAGSAAPRAVPARQGAPSAPQAPTVAVDVVVLDRDGQLVDGLRPASFTVTVDGKPRRILWVRFVTRGPGSLADAQQRQAGRTESLYFAAEPARNILVVVDEASLQRGSERLVLQAAGALIDRLGLDDRVGVIRVPMPRDSRVTLTTVRPEVRQALREVTGQAVQPAVTAGGPPAQAADAARATGDPGQAAGVERLPIEAVAGNKAPDAGAQEAPGLLENLQAILAALQSSPGRKIIAVFSGGLLPALPARVDDIAHAATAAGTVIHAFGIQGVHDDLPATPDLSALERLARATGGSYSTLGKNPERNVGRMVAEMSAMYVLGVEGTPSDSDGRLHAVRVETPRLALSLRTPGWLAAVPDVEDLVPAVSIPAGEPSPAAAPAPADPSAGAAPVARVVVPFARNAGLQRLIGRASDYIAGYQREYSLLVADENYLQTTRTERQQIRSDLLLVRTPGDDGWVSFRDVYEVNGVAVRGREDRLRRLFLDPSAEAQAQLQAIKDESARYNLGGRNINVPLFPLKFLEQANLLHFDYKENGTQEVGGVEASRISYVEWARPTLVRYSSDRNIAENDNLLKDIPASGWFLIDPVSGAIVGSRLEMTYDPDRVKYEIEVRYQRDASLGLWVPAEMRESYSSGRPGSLDRAVTLEGKATYSKFRRFQVTTEEKIRVLK